MNTFWFYQNNLYLILQILTPLLILDLILRAMAMWKSAKNNQLFWFIALAIFNTLGILPTIYLTFFQRIKHK